MTMMTEIGIMQTQAKENQRLLTNQQKVERGQEEVLHGLTRSMALLNLDFRLRAFRNVRQ